MTTHEHDFTIYERGLVRRPRMLPTPSPWRVMVRFLFTFTVIGFVVVAILVYALVRAPWAAS